MEELGTTSPGFRLDLNNFDSSGAERSRYVLTSPRSLQSCARLGIKPVELLIRSLNELMAEQRDVPLEVVSVMHASYEKERKRLLQICRQERERIIQEAGAGRPGHDRKVFGLEVVPESKVKDGSKGMPYADLCFKRKSVSRLSCSTAGKRNPDRSAACSLSLGDLAHSPATEMKLERLTEDIEKKLCVTVSERDRKIAALMLVRHQQEQDSVELRQREERERREARGREEARRAQAEKERRETLRQSMQRWHEMLGARRRLRQRREEERARQREQEVLMQEDRWRRLRGAIEARRREKIEAAQKDAGGRKRCQEKLLREKEELERRGRERERQVAAEREQEAGRSRATREEKRRRWLEEAHRQEPLRHVLLKQRAERQAEEEEARARSTMERKLQHSCEKHARAVEARLRGRQERALREEERIQRARLRAELQDVQRLGHKHVLVLLSQRRVQGAALRVSALQRARAQRTGERNARRWLCHRVLRDRLRREEEAARKVREACVSVKERRRERLQGRREQTREEARRMARASSHMRERVRQQTHGRTFDQMALEAQLIASMSFMKV